MNRSSRWAARDAYILALAELGVKATEPPSFLDRWVLVRMRWIAENPRFGGDAWYQSRFVDPDMIDEAIKLNDVIVSELRSIRGDSIERAEDDAERAEAADRALRATFAEYLLSSVPRANPFVETRQQFLDRAARHYRAVADVYKHHGFAPAHKRRELARDACWTARYVLGDRTVDIAGANQRQAVYRRIEEFAKLAGITLPRQSFHDQ